MRILVVIFGIVLIMLLTRGCKIDCVRGQPERMKKMEDEGVRHDPGQSHNDSHSLD
jgi:hypothetical protein